MSHWLILPILLPLFAGSLLLLPLAERWQRGLSLLAALALIPLSLLLIRTAASGDLSVYALGNWAAPFGIVLMLDRLAALMLLATAVLGSAALIYALRGDDRLGKHFHALFQFQLLGINGAFLTGDLFNLFVFFEILLIASYALLLHGGGAERVRSGLHYVILNLVGSAFFLIAVGTLYGLTGTLNMADMAQKIAMADAERAPLLAAAGLLLLVVFALKAALLPLYFWLPRAYAAASAPVAALFAIMTKVGIYSILRVYTLVFGDAAGELANLAQAWLWPLALATLGLARSVPWRRGPCKACWPTWWWSPPEPSWLAWRWAASGRWRRRCTTCCTVPGSPVACSCSPTWSPASAATRPATWSRARRCRILGCSAGLSSSAPSPLPVCRHCRGSSARSCFCSRSLPAARRWPYGAWYWAAAWWRWWR